MSARSPIGSVFFWRRSMLACGRAAAICLMGITAVSVLAGAVAFAKQPLSRGAELFTKTWKVKAPGDLAGDGLGPVFNARSCADCHRQGGIGGGGPAEANVQLLSINVLAGNAKPSQIHPGFATDSTVVLHRFSIAPGYDRWRASRILRVGGAPQPSTAEFAASRIAEIEPQKSQNNLPVIAGPLNFNIPTPRPHIASVANEIQRRVAKVESAARSLRQVRGNVATLSERNTTALFGLGQVDKIPDEVLVALAERQSKISPAAKGRVAKLRDGRVGHFGWKGQKATLEDFVLTACAVELGLNVPGHPQGIDPRKTDYKPLGVDMDEQDCGELVSFVKAMAAPVERPSAAAETVAGGKRLLDRIGCTDCHSRDVGEVKELYSDLLLHDMGVPSGYLDSLSVACAPQRDADAADSEWRTPPLWGCHDSAPYMHDGRATTLREAILMHGGHGAASRDRFVALSAIEQGHVLAFLNSLIAPLPPQEHKNVKLRSVGW